MSKICDRFFQTAAATAVVAALSAWPASGRELVTGREATVPTALTVVATDKRNLIAASDAMAMRRKPKPIRVVQTSPPRTATVSRHDWSCSDSWCGRQFVLMIGISY
jgi:hypothetical protein